MLLLQHFYRDPFIYASILVQGQGAVSRNIKAAEIFPPGQI